MFKLLIECSKDISELQINFSDGTSSVVETPKQPKVESDKVKEEALKSFKEPRKKLEQYLDTSQEFTVSQEVVEKPKIEDKERIPKVDSNMQGLDF